MIQGQQPRIAETTSMPKGICKLCQKTKPLENSHLIPRAMYQRIRDENVRASWSNPDPIHVGKTVTAHTSRQVTDYVLCTACEDLFNKKGETWMIQQVWRSTAFPLLDRLNLAHPQFEFQDALGYSGTAVGIDTDKLGYFALSVFWRAGVHIWSVGFGQKSTKLDLGIAEKDIRLFLLSQGPIPQTIALIATVCTDQESMGVIVLAQREMEKRRSPLV